jgi:hypothetical protein
MKPFTTAYAIGYYYGRAYPNEACPDMPDADLLYRNTISFHAGLERGRADYQDVDLPLIVAETELVD